MRHKARIILAFALAPLIRRSPMVIGTGTARVWCHDPKVWRFVLARYLPHACRAERVVGNRPTAAVYPVVGSASDIHRLCRFPLHRWRCARWRWRTTHRTHRNALRCATQLALDPGRHRHDHLRPHVYSVQRMVQHHRAGSLDVFGTDAGYPFCSNRRIAASAMGGRTDYCIGTFPPCRMIRFHSTACYDKWHTRASHADTAKK